MKPALVLPLLLGIASCATKTPEKASAPPVAKQSAAPSVPAVSVRGELPELARFGGNPLVADDEVRTVAYSPDGKWIASGGGGERGHDVLIWNAATGERLYTLSGATESIQNVAFSPDGRFLVASGLSTPVFVWDVQTRTIVHELPRNGASTYDFRFAADGQTLYTLDSEEHVLAWDLRQTKPSSRVLHEGGKLLNEMALSQDGKQIIVTGDDGHFWMIPTNSKDRAKDIDGQMHRIHSVAYAPDDTFFLTGDLSHEGKYVVSVRDPRTGARTRTLEGQSDHIAALRISQDMRWIVSGSNGGRLVVWEAATGKIKLEGRSRQKDPIWFVGISPDGQRIAAAGRSRVIEIWDVDKGTTLLNASGHTGQVAEIAYSRDGAIIASGDSEGIVLVRDARTGAEKARFPRMEFGITTLAFSPDGRHLLAMAHGRAKFWDTSSWAEVFRLEKGRMAALRFSPDGKWLVASDESRIVRLIDARTGAEGKTFGEEQLGDNVRQNLMTPSSVAFTSDGQRMAVARWDQPVQVWNVQTGAREKTLDGTLFVTYSPDDRLMITGWGQVSKRSPPLHLQIWDAATGNALREIDAEPPAVFSPRGDSFATLSEGEVQLWDTQSGERIARTASGTHKPTCFAFSGDGLRIATGGLDTTVRVFEVKRIGEAMQPHP